jgi:hypothetical protein
MKIKPLNVFGVIGLEKLENVQDTMFIVRLKFGECLLAEKDMSLIAPSAKEWFILIIQKCHKEME